MYHVFVVNDRTFKYHLEYLFAGTYTPQNPVFLENSEYRNPLTKQKNGVTPKQELSICGLIADVSRIRPGDKVIFYLTQTSKHDGMFFGVFTTIGKAFFDSNDNNYLSSELGIHLNFRVKLLPDIVYAKGISERDALDSLSGIDHPSQMCWSLIYRKLKGKRGCTMITDYEGDRLVKLLKKVNENGVLKSKYFTYDKDIFQIKGIKEGCNYNGVEASLNIKERMMKKACQRKSYEAHFQAYILQHIDESPICNLLNIDKTKALWIGNEVSCGVGMQSIDIVTQQCIERDAYINIIELKCVEPYVDILKKQLPKYETWFLDYIAPLYKHKRIHICPIIIAKSFKQDNQTKCFIDYCKQVKSYTKDNVIIEPVSYIEYKIDEDVKFTKRI